MGEWLTVRQVADLLNVAPSTVWRHAGSMYAVKIGNTTRIPKAGLAKYLERQRINQDAPAIMAPCLASGNAANGGPSAGGKQASNAKKAASKPEKPQPRGKQPTTNAYRQVIGQSSPA